MLGAQAKIKLKLNRSNKKQIKKCKAKEAQWQNRNLIEYWLNGCLSLSLTHSLSRARQESLSVNTRYFSAIVIYFTVIFNTHLILFILSFLVCLSFSFSFRFWLHFRFRFELLEMPCLQFRWVVCLCVGQEETMHRMAKIFRAFLIVSVCVCVFGNVFFRYLFSSDTRTTQDWLVHHRHCKW